MKILVTGGAGYIGSCATKLLLEKGFTVVVVDNLSRGFRQAIETLQKKFGLKSLVFYEADLCDYLQVDKILKKEKLAGVMHFAALCLVSESMEKPDEYFDNNVVGTLNLLRAMRKNKVRSLVFSSTSTVYGENQYLPVDEKHPLRPINPYGESKLIGEKMIEWFGRIYDLKYAILRYFNVSGASSDGLVGDSKKPSQLLVQNAVRGALGIEPFKLTCPKVKTKDQTPIRDYVNIEDLVEAHLVAWKYLQRGGKSDVFNLGTGKGNSVLEIVKKIQEETGVDFSLKQGKVRKGEHAEIFADISKAKRILHWGPKKTIKDSVLSLVKWYRVHPQGWEY